MEIRALILAGYGINCEYETAHCFREAGARAEIVHLGELLRRDKRIEDYHIIAFPGGFSFGDDIASGKVLANKFKYNLFDDLLELIESGGLIIGICNGFQVLAKMGLLPAFDGKYGVQQVTLTFNDSGRFEDRWVHLRVEKSRCVFTRGIEKMYLPVRHAEGKFFSSQEVLERLKKNGQIVMRYVNPDGGRAHYPWNPNGSLDDIAGICDETGRVFGLMPHPEAFNHFTNHPRWTREEVRETGMKIFENAVRYVRENF